MIRVALVGAGGMARTHAASYARIGNAALVGVMDIRLEAASELAGLHSAAPFSDFDAMLTAVRPDAVDICCPTPFHAEYVCRAAEAGAEIGIRAICTEKPMARSLEQCDRMIEAARRAGIPLFVAHVVRFFPEFAELKSHVEAGSVGKPAAIRTRRGGRMPRAWDDWYADYARSGGLILDLLVHDFDWLRWTFGEVERVYARGCADSRLPLFDYALVTLRFKSGAIAHVEGTWNDPSGFKVSVEVAGDRGLLDFNFNQPAPAAFRSSVAAVGAGRAAVEAPESPTDKSPYQLELEHYIGCIEQGRTPSITPEDGRAALAIALAAMESVRTGRPVTPG